MEGGENKTNQLYAKMNIQDDDLDEDTAEAFMFTIRRRTSAVEEEEPRFSTADNHLPPVEELATTEVNSAAQVIEAENHDDSASKDATDEKDDKSSKKSRQKKSPRSPSFCNLS